MPLAEDPEESGSGSPPPSAVPLGSALGRAQPESLAQGSLSFFRQQEEERPQPAPGLASGKIVGDFRLVALIGQGGMGQVWEAEQISLGRRHVAVKFVRPERVTERQLELFAREARAGGRLHHPGIVTVYGHGQSDDLAWIAMEFVEGAWTLRDFLDEIARAEEVPHGYDRRVARFVAEIADAMQAAHEAAVIHRDLKPQNILIAPDEHPKVTDFGLARITDESAMSQTGDFAGTYFYMSPEQVAARRAGLDHRTDVFSLGILLYEMLALQRPFQGDTSHQVAAQILAKDPPDPRTLRSKVPRDLAVIAGKALEKDRDKRYATMKELAADLRRYLGNEPIRATPPTRMDRTVKWIQRNPTKSTAAAVAVVAFAAITWLLLENLRANRALATKTTEAEASAAEARENARVARTNESRAVEGEKQAQQEKERATQQKERADREAEAATKRADEVLRLSAFQRLVDLESEADRLWPAEPEELRQYERWLERAHDLVAGLEPHGDDPGHRAQLAKLRERAIPLTEEERQAKRRAHPRFGELAPLEKELAALRAAREVRDGKARPTIFALDAPRLPSDAGSLNWLARPLVDPARTEFGREAEGLALARLAIEKVEDDESAARAGDTLAWALFANGLDDEALRESATAVEAAPADHRSSSEDQAAELRKAVEAARSGSTLAAVESELAAVEAELSSVERIRFAHEQDTWWHNQLQKLVAEIEAFADPKTGLIVGLSPEHGWGIAKRRDFAATVAERSVSSTEAQRLWSAAIASIASPEECPKYGGLRITPQLGLLPIGRDPDSGLWEFAHLLSGDPAVRGADGKLVLTESMGLVFVLLPGGVFEMGAQNTAPSQPNYDAQARSDESPVREVTLSPFFLSKYELTQGQWLRFTGRNPSLYAPHYYDRDWNRAGRRGDLLHPVEQVSWTRCTETCSRLGLILPSEAQWEHGARAGTDTPWWTGTDPKELASAGNVADAWARAHGANADWNCEAWDDGNTGNAAVGSYRANPLGLHDMIGNVWEWCEDKYGSSFRVLRGGGFADEAVYARSAARNGNSPVYADANLGCRPARTIAP